MVLLIWVLLHFILPLVKGMKMPKKNVSEKPEVAIREVKAKITEEDEAKIIKKYFGCHPKYIRVRGTSVTIDVTGMAMNGEPLNCGLLESRSRV